MKQVNLAKQVGISESYLSLILDGLRRPSWDVASRLSELTGTPVRLWMEGDESEKRDAINSAKGNGERKQG